MMNSDNERGFTLVELAIVMIIIGLLIGGILKGQQLIINARIASTIAQIKSIDAAYLTFLDSYRYYPGDVVNATARIPNCTAANSCQSGNGNRVVGDVYMGGNAIGDKFYTQAETVQFWKHLALIDLISNVDESADPANPGWGKTHPNSHLGGGFEIFYEGLGLFGVPIATGQMLRLTNNGLSPTAVDGPGEAVLSPAMAAAMEAKMDDGSYNTGRMFVWDYGNHGCDNRSDGSVGFDETEDIKSCVTFFKLPR